MPSIKSKSWEWAVICCPLLMVLGCVPFWAGVTQETADLSDFQEFEFTTSGFPPETDVVRSALIRKNGSGEYFVRMKILKGYREAYENWEDQFILDDLAERQLTEAEVQRMTELFSQVVIDTVPWWNSVCADVLYSYDLRWDERTWNSSCAGCGHTVQCVGSDMFEQIILFLESLRAGWE